VSHERSRPRVSVVIPCLNGRRFVEEAIDSVLGQTFPHLELVVIDDGSTDGSEEVIRAHVERSGAAAPVTVVAREHRGKGFTLNQGLDMARGEFFAALDADDVWEPDKLAGQVTAMERNGPDVAGTFSDAVVIDAQGRVIDRLGRLYPYRGGDIFMDLVFERFVPPSPTSLFRKRAIVRVGGYDQRRIAEDFDLWIRLARMYRFVFIPRALARYRIHGVNMSIRQADRMFDEARCIIEELLEVDPSLRPYRPAVEARITARYAAHQYNNLRLREAREHAISALMTLPSERLAWVVLARSMLGRSGVRLLRAARGRIRERVSALRVRRIEGGP
jgi:glycosyltransferase involved in cell wall biosynthesis